MNLQAADQQNIRREQLRREAYARCSEHLMGYLARLNDWTRPGWNAGQEALESMRQEAAEVRRRGLSCAAEVALVGPRSMFELFQDADGRLMAVERKLEVALITPRLADESSKLSFGTLDTYGTDRALERFFEGARGVLGFDEID